MKADDIPNECIDDPRFVKVLAASLCSEIAESKIILTEINTQIGELKESVAKGWEKRKILKQSICELSKKKQVLTGALESLTRDQRSRSIEVETAKNRLDDGTLREIHERAEFERILENYHDTWQRYKVEYEKRPLAIERQQCCINLKQLGIQYMIAEYKKEEFMKMMRQRWEINAVRIKRSIVDLSEMVLNRWKEEKYLEHLKRMANNIRDELTVYTRQLTEMQQREVERKRLAESDETAKMPPPRLDFPFMRPMKYTGEQLVPRPINDRNHRKHLMQHWRMTNKSRNYSPSRDESDTASINTLMLEEIFHQVPNKSLRIPEDREEKLENAANSDNESVQEESHCTLPLPSSILMIQESATESPRPIINVPSKITSAAVSSTPIVINESSIRQKLQKLDIEKKNDSLPHHHHYHQEEEQQPMPNHELNNNDNFNDDNGDEDKTKEYEKDINNVQDSRTQRTRRWCQELTRENLPSACMLPENNQVRCSIKSVLNEETQANSIDRETPLMMTESHLRHYAKNDKRERKNSSRQTNEEMKISKIDGNREDGESGVVDKEQRDSLSASRLVDSIYGATIQKSKLRNDYSTDDLLHADEGSRPKIRRIAENDETASLIEVEQQQVRRTITMEPNQLANIASPSRRYVPSCVSSDNLSHMVDAASWQETPQGILAGKFKIDADFPSLPNWDTWSPPQLHSEMSFASSSITNNQDGKKDSAPINQQETQEIGPPLDFGVFTTKTSQNTRKMF